MQLFFILGMVQTLLMGILADSDSIRYLINEAVYIRLPYKPPIRDPGVVRLIFENSEALYLKCFAVLPVSLNSKLVWHEFGVMPYLPLDMFIESDVLDSNCCSL